MEIQQTIAILMNKPTKLSALLPLLLVSLHASAVSPISSPLVNPSNNHTYYLLSSASWTDSEAFAQTMGGHLVAINDAAENSWVFSTFFSLTPAPAPSLWIGLTDQSSEGTFFWANGEPVTFTSWYFGEPNNTPNIDPTGEDFVSMRGPQNPLPSTWNDLPNAGGGEVGSVFGVVEVVPEPQALQIFAIGLTALLIYSGNRIRNRA